MNEIHELKKHVAMTNFKHFVGIDIAKKKIDVALIKDGDRTNIISNQFSNDKKGFVELENWLSSHLGQLDEQTVICMEYTGIYNNNLCEFLAGLPMKVCLEAAFQIQRSIGMVRGKNDRIDAVRIAEYARKNADSLRIWRKSNETVIALKHLLSQRERLIKSKTALEAPVKELQEIGIKKTAKMLHQGQAKVIREIEKAILHVEKQIQELIDSDLEIKKNFERLVSIPGIGKVNAWCWIVFTCNFNRFNNAKQMACFVGVAPFEHTSGSSVRGKTRVSNLANKKLKSMLHMAAMSAIQDNAELKDYYRRKLAEGKNKMSVINAVRNKLVHRIFAVIRDQRMYEPKMIVQYENCVDNMLIKY